MTLTLALHLTAGTEPAKAAERLSCPDETRRVKPWPTGETESFSITDCLCANQGDVFQVAVDEVFGAVRYEEWDGPAALDDLDEAVEKDYESGEMPYSRLEEYLTGFGLTLEEFLDRHYGSGFESDPDAAFFLQRELDEIERFRGANEGFTTVSYERQRIEEIADAMIENMQEEINDLAAALGGARYDHALTSPEIRHRSCYDAAEVTAALERMLGVFAKKSHDAIQTAVDNYVMDVLKEELRDDDPFSIGRSFDVLGVKARVHRRLMPLLEDLPEAFRLEPTRLEMGLTPPQPGSRDNEDTDEGIESPADEEEDADGGTDTGDDALFGGATTADTGSLSGLDQLVELVEKPQTLVLMCSGSVESQESDPKLPVFNPETGTFEKPTDDELQQSVLNPEAEALNKTFGERRDCEEELEVLQRKLFDAEHADDKNTEEGRRRIKELEEAVIAKDRECDFALGGALITDDPEEAGVPCAEGLYVVFTFIGPVIVDDEGRLVPRDSLSDEEVRQCLENAYATAIDEFLSTDSSGSADTDPSGEQRTCEEELEMLQRKLFDAEHADDKNTEEGRRRIKELEEAVIAKDRECRQAADSREQVQVIDDIRLQQGSLADLLQQFLAPGSDNVTSLNPGSDQVSSLSPNVSGDIQGNIDAINDSQAQNENDDDDTSSSSASTGGGSDCPDQDTTFSLSYSSTASTSDLLSDFQALIAAIRVVVDGGSAPCTVSIFFDTAFTSPLFSTSMSPGDSISFTLSGSQTVSLAGFDGTITATLSGTATMDSSGNISVSITGGSASFSGTNSGGMTGTAVASGFSGST